MTDIPQTSIPDAASAAPAAPAETTARPRRLRPLLTLVPFAMRYRGRIALALIALLVAALATLAVPIAVRRMIDFGFSAERLALINQYFAMMLVVAAILACASAARFYLVTTIGERVVADVRAAVFAHVTTLSPAFFDRTMTGELISRLAADTTQIKSAVGVSVSTVIRNLVLFAGSVGLMVYTSPRLSAFVLGAIPIIVLPLVAFGRMVRKRSRLAQDTLADASSYAAELIGVVRALQAYTNEKMANTRYGAAVERAYNAALFSIRARALLVAVVIFLVFASVVVVLWVGAQDVIGGHITPGILSQFLLYAVLAASSLSQISDVWAEVSQTAGAAERLAELLAIEPEIVAPPRPVKLTVPPRGEVAFEAVRFAYPTRPETFALDGVGFRVRPGEKVAIVGPSGAGKSTVFHLLLRFYDPASGRVQLDGVDLRDADPRDVRARIALVPQESAILAASIADNIRFGRPDASSAEVARAAELAAASEFVSRLPQGLETVVGERGVTISGGQRQRIAIARAILREAPLLLLDEATSALDAQSETLVQAALDRLMQERTTIVIAHRLATVLKCDRILVMDRGRILEEGTHESLVAHGGLYARLARLQFQSS